MTVWDCASGVPKATYQAPGYVQMMLFSPDSSRVWFTVVYRNTAWFDDLIRRLGLPMSFAFSSLKQTTIVFDAATGEECTRLRGFGFSNVLSARGDTLATLSPEGDAIQLWDLPPRRALNPFVAWGCFGVAFLVTGAWCYVWRLGRMARFESENAAQPVARL